MGSAPRRKMPGVCTEWRRRIYIMAPMKNVILINGISLNGKLTSTIDVRIYFEDETTAYEALKNIQGRCIPRLLAKVKVDSYTASAPSNPTPNNLAVNSLAQYFEVSGILLEYIDGFILSD